MGEKKISCRHILLSKHTSEFVKEDTFELIEGEIDTDVKPGTGDVVVRNILLSVDPWTRLCMHSQTQGLYFPVFEAGKPMPAITLAKVITSDNPEFHVGDHVIGVGTVSEYNLMPGGKDIYVGAKLRKVEGSDNVPLENYHGLLGLPGATAWQGLVELAQVKAGEEVFISAASGGVGLAAGQIAKMKGCRVVGSTSSDDKVRLLTEKFGFDNAFNYKTEADWDATLKKCFPNGIDVYLDNVGGKMLEASLNNINFQARIILSGMISQYNQDWKEAYGVQNLMNLVGRCAKMEGFRADPVKHANERTKDMIHALNRGKIQSIETITDGIENFPKAYVGMMKGENVGKALVRL